MRETELILAQMSSRSGQGKDTLGFDWDLPMWGSCGSNRRI